MSDHKHSFSVDTACECGVMLSAYVRTLTARCEDQAHELELAKDWAKTARAHRESLESRLRAAEEALCEVLNSGVSFQDERLDYKEVQITDATFDLIREALAPAHGKGNKS